jgi:DNA repair photolyase
MTIKDSLPAYASPRWSGEIADCSMPMTFDTYSRCSYGCLYCFAAYQQDINRSGKAGLKAVNVERVRRMFTDPDTHGGQFAPFIRARKVMQWGGLADQFDEFERKHGRTLELLRLFRELEYPLSFSTKGTWWTKDERYMELFRGAPWHVKVSIITLDAAKATKIEVGVDSPAERLAAIARIRTCIDHVTLRLRPFLIGATNPRHRELIAAAADAGADSVSTEYFCLERRSPAGRAYRYDRMSRVLGYDIVEFYKRHSPGQSGYLRLSRPVKRRFVDEMEEECRLRGLRFHVSDCDFKERGCTGSCCGLPEDWAWCRGQLTEALLVAKRDGLVRWSQLSPHLEYAQQFFWRDAAGFNTGDAEARARHYFHTMYDVLHNAWNNPHEAHGPFRYFGGVLKPVGLDEAGDLVYQYDEGAT